MNSMADEDLRLINEVKTLIDEVIDKVPPKKDMNLVNVGAIVVFSLGCIVGLGMFVFTLYLTSTVILSFILLGIFFVLGFLIGVYIEKVDSINKSSNPLYFNY